MDNKQNYDQDPEQQRDDEISQIKRHLEQMAIQYSTSFLNKI